MPLVTTGELVARAAAADSAVAAFNIITLEHVEAVVAGAESAGRARHPPVSENAVSSARAVSSRSPAPPPSRPNAPPYPSHCTWTTSRATTCCARRPTPASAP